MLIKSLDFGAGNKRIQGALEYGGIYTTEALEVTDDASLLRIPNLGRLCLSTIRKTVAHSEWQVWTPERQEAEFAHEYSTPNYRR